MDKLFITLFLALAAVYADAQSINVLVFTKTNGYYHQATANATKAFYEITHDNQWEMTITNDSTSFMNLQKYDVIVFLLTGGDVLNEAQQRTFQKFIRNGGGFVGVHSATTTEYDWPWYGDLVGAYFKGHPPVQPGKLIIENKHHPATAHFGVDTLDWTDEWYTFKRNPRHDVEVLLSIDENSYNIDDNPWFKDSDLKMGDHPLVWCQMFDGGRSFQTALGHVPELYDTEVFRKHLAGAVEWAAGRD